jgi:hypothetical protein
MQRRTYLLLGLAVGAVAVAIWSFTRQAADSQPDVVAALPQPVPAASMVASQPATPPANPTKTTTQLILDTSSGDAATRASAIEALADAPRAEALPVLGRILTDGEPQVDRVLALRSLRDLALNQGDADGAIRDAIRHAIYHGDDLTQVDDVQEALEVIEESLQAQRDVSVSHR